MRRIIATALFAALAIPGIATDARAHGGIYVGPGGAVPPNLREPSDPVPPPPPPQSGPPVTGPPTTPTRPAPPMGGPGDGPTTGDPTPFTSPSGRRRGAKATITPDSWVFWYETNKTSLEDLKHHIYAMQGSNNGPFGTSLPEAGAHSGVRHATRAKVKLDIVPALLWAIDPKNAQHQDVESAAYIGLSKVTDDPRHIELIQRGVASKNGVTAESCCLSLGLLRRERREDQFSAKTLDQARAFLFSVLEDDKQLARKRAFAALGIGLLGDQPAGSDSGGGAAATTAHLFRLLETKYSTPDISVALLLAVSMQPSAAIMADQRELLRTAVTKRRLGKLDVQDLVASYAALALGRIGDPEQDTRALQRVLTARSAGLNVRRSAAISLGTLGKRASPERRAEIAGDIVDSINRRRLTDQTALNFALISLAYLVQADVRSEHTGVLGDARVGKFLLKQVEDGRYAARTYAALSLGLACRAIGDTPRTEIYGEFQSNARQALRAGLRTANMPKRARGAYAVALGIARDQRSSKDLVALVADKKEDDELRGYAAIALGHIGVATKQVLTPIREALVARRSEKLRRATATALGLLTDSGAVPILLDELRRARSQSAKGQVVIALAKVGDERAIQPLVDMLRNTKEQELTRALACAGLGIVGDLNWIRSFARISNDINYRASCNAIDEVLSIL